MTETVEAAAAVIGRLVAGGARFSVDAEQIHCDAPPGTVTDVDRAWLREHRDDVRRFVADTSAPQRRPAGNGDDGRRVRLTDAQVPIWLAHTQQQSSTAFNEVVAVSITGCVYPGAIESAIRAVESANEVARLRFSAGLDGPVQYVDRSPLTRLPIIELSEAAVRLRPDLVRDVVECARSRRFDVDREPPWRWALVRSSDTWTLASIRHHLTTDGGSIEPLLEDLAAAYTRAADGQPVALGPRVQFLDVAEAQRARVRWGLTPAGATANSAMDGGSAVPEAEVSPSASEATGASGRRFPLRSDAGSSLDQLARRLGTSPFAVLLAVGAVALARWSGEIDLRVGYPVDSRRPPEHGVQGCFSSLATARIVIDGDEPLSELVARVSEMVGRSIGTPSIASTALVNTVFVAQDLGSDPVAVPGLVVEPLGIDPPSKFPLNVVLIGSGDDARAFVEVGPDRSELDNMASGVAGDLGAIMAAAASGPLRSVAAVVSEAVRPSSPCPLGSVEVGPSAFASADVVDRLLERAAEQPDAVAVTDVDGMVSYGQLARRAAGLGTELHRQGVVAGDLVAVDLPRGVEQATAALGVLMIGACYLPLELEQPIERRAQLVQRSGCRAVVSHAAARWSGTVDVVVDPSSVPDRVPHSASVVPETLPAYVIHTSGTTGSPNGVVIGRANLAGLLARAGDAFERSDRTLVVHSPAFDFAVWELWGALASGTTVHLVPPECVRDPAKLARTLVDRSISVLSATPSLLSLLAPLATAIARAGTLRRIVLGGESVDRATVRSWREAGGRTPDIENWYGITETTVHVTRAPSIDTTGDTWHRGSPVGHPLEGWTVDVVDPFGVSAPAGATGELLVGGVGVSTGGYLARPRLTASRFLPDPVGGGSRRYRTGDRGVAVGSTLWHAGRLDEQFTVRGHRVEPGEIEAHLATVDGVAGVVVGLDDRSGHPVLTAWYRTHLPMLAAEVLANRALEILPPHLVPQAWCHVEAFPVNQNGKLDRDRLPVGRVGRGVTGRPASTATESVLTELWVEVVGGDPPPVDRNIYLLGADSMMLARLTASLPEALGVELTLGDVMANPDLASLAALIDTRFVSTAKDLDELAQLLDVVEGSHGVGPGKGQIR